MRLVYWEARLGVIGSSGEGRRRLRGARRGAAFIDRGQRVVAAAARHNTPSSEMFSLLVRLCALAPSTLSAPSVCGALWAFCIDVWVPPTPAGRGAAAPEPARRPREAATGRAQRHQLGAHGAAACRGRPGLAGPARPRSGRHERCLHAVAAAAPSSNAVAWLGDAGDDACSAASSPSASGGASTRRCAPRRASRASRARRHLEDLERRDWLDILAYRSRRSSSGSDG